MKKAVIYGRTNPPCQYCESSKIFLKNEKIDYEYKEIDDFVIDYIQNKENVKIRTLPQIYIDDKYIGGYKDLVEHVNHEKNIRSLEL